eukprot:g5229.t1
MSQLCKFAILNCENDEKWLTLSKTVRENVRGNINRFVEFFVDSFGEESDSWEAYACYDYHWPTIEEAKSFDAIFITGSGYSVYNNELKWVPELCDMLQLYYHEDIRLVGICFGAHLLGLALGGKVDKNPGPYVAKIEDIHVVPELAVFVNGASTVSMIESHGDQVTELPTGAVLLGHSNSCKNEIWFLNSALAIQGHPEFHPDTLLKVILPSLKRAKVLSTLDVIHSGRNLRNKKTDHGIIISLIKNFTRSDSMVSSSSYRSLFASHLNSYTDKALIKQIDKLTDNFAERPFADEEGSKFRNPVDLETRQVVQNSVNTLKAQFSTLMLNELKRTMIDYHGLDDGNTLILEDAKVLLSKTLDLYKPIKQLRSERLTLTKEVNQVINEVTIMMNSLEESARLLERETNNLKQRILQ